MERVVSVATTIPQREDSPRDEDAIIDTEIGEWSNLTPRCTLRGQRSHSRDVYKLTQPIMIGKTRAKGCVLKISDKEDRYYKLADWPCTEEVAYKISKLFRWSIIPKTKVMHPDGPEISGDSEKYLSYRALWLSLGKSFRELPTVTFQALVEGEPFLVRKDTASSLESTIPMDAHHKAFLLGAVLGKKDARGDNVLRETATGSLIEIDNELLGAYGYDLEGVLRHFQGFMDAEIDASIVDEFLAVSLDALLEIRRKYEERDDFLTRIWVIEYQTIKPGVTLDSLQYNQRHSWQQVCKNFYFIQESIKELREKGSPITLNTLEQLYKEKLSDFDRKVRAKVDASGPRLPNFIDEYKRRGQLIYEEGEKLLAR